MSATLGTHDQHDTGGATSEPGASTGKTGGLAPRLSVPTKLVFFLVLLLALLTYTQMAFQLEWVTKAGRIGPGFFPRIIGTLATLLTAWALVQAWRNPADAADGFEEEDQGEADLGRHPLAMLFVIVAAAVFLLTFVPLGAIVSGALFCFIVLAYLNRGQWIVNAILAIAVSVGMYLLFQTALNAGLPAGILPRF